MSAIRKRSSETALNPERRVLADLQAGIARCRAEQVAPLIAAEQKAEEIVLGHEATLRQFDGLDDELHQYHRGQIERQVSSGEVPSLELPADLRRKREQRDAAIGYLNEARAYRDRVRAERLHAERQTETMKAPIADEVISIFKGKITDLVQLYLEAEREMQLRWADLVGALRTEMVRWNGSHWVRYDFADLEDAHRVRLFAPGVRGQSLPRAVAARLDASATAYTQFRDKLYKDATAEVELD